MPGRGGDPDSVATAATSRERRANRPAFFLPAGRSALDTWIGGGMNGTKSKVEVLKEESRQLRGTIAHDLWTDAPSVGESSRQLLKFHGLYEQDDRDHRKEGVKSCSFMIRTKLPGGRLTPAQYLAHDELAGRFGNGTLRITTRQDLQLHGVLKRDVKSS